MTYTRILNWATGRTIKIRPLVGLNFGARWEYLEQSPSLKHACDMYILPEDCSEKPVMSVPELEQPVTVRKGVERRS